MDSAYWFRLKSFTLPTWFSKPPSFSPIECAKYGYSNTARDEITCVQCGGRIVARPGEFLPGEVLRRKHVKDCGYRDGLEVDWREAEEFGEEEYRRRLGTINRGVVYLPALSIPLLSEHAQHSLIPMHSFTLSQIYACFGWEAHSETSVQCGVCHMTISLSANTEEDRSPILGHRERCPWVSTGVEGVCGWRVILERIEGEGCGRSGEDAW